jgi:hypothetical protein
MCNSNLESCRLAFGLSQAVDAPESDAFRALVVLDFESVAIEDGDDGCCASLTMWTGPLTEEGDMDMR